MSVHFIVAALELAQANGHEPGRALEIADIKPELIDEPAARVTETQAARLIQALWDASDDELVGAGPKPVPRGTFRMIALAVLSARDLAGALHRLVEFVRIGMGFEGIEVVGDVETAQLSFHSPSHDQTSQQVAAIFLAVVHRFAGWLIGQQIILTSAQLPGAPRNSIEYVRVYGVSPRFESATAAITFESRYLRAPLIQDEAGLDELLRSSPSALLFRQDYNISTSSRVRRIVERSSTPGAVSVEAAARHLNISAQHLRRLLREEGASFRQIKVDALRDEAVASLVVGRESIEALSRRLGFSEPSAFRRAFRRWTGSSPSAYRA